MKRSYSTRGFAAAIALSAFVTGCASGTPAAVDSPASAESVAAATVPERFRSGDPVKVKVIRKIGGDDHTAQFLAGAKEEGEAMGFAVDVFSAEGDAASFHAEVDKTLAADYDAVILSHGDDAATIDDAKRLVEKGIRVVTFDSNVGVGDVAGVTMTAQDDRALATLAMEQLVEDHDGEANLVYLWVDGFPPMVRRNAVYQEMLAKYPGLREVARFGVASADTSAETKEAVAALLKEHPMGSIDAIFATWDAFAIGALEAIREAGRSEIKLYGIDVSNSDLALMQEQGSSWAYTAAVDPKLIGAVNMRLAARKIAGADTPATFELDAYLIGQDELRVSSETVTMDTLPSVLPGWGLSFEAEEAWMKALKAQRRASAK